MAKLIVIFAIISSILVAMPTGNHATKHVWFQNICQGKEKVAKIQVYLQDRFSGENQTVYEVARSNITSESPTAFGRVVIADSPLTAGPDINSEEVGRAQGQGISADLTTSTLAMYFNVIFTSGKYNGSTISLLGRNEIVDDVRELPIVGGTGIFQFARGYTITRTIELNSTRGVLEYTFYVSYVPDSKVNLEANM